MVDVAGAAQARRGVRRGDEFVFTCASCGGVAATLRIVTQGQVVDGGPMRGGKRLTWPAEHTSRVLEFVSVNSGRLDARLVPLLAGSETVDPVDIRAIDRELAAFCCRRCGQNYCVSCWGTWVHFDDGFYDGTRGRCPRGHQQTLDG